MKVKVGETVCTDFGSGPIVAMSRDWCIVQREKNGKPSGEEIAVPWDQVFIPATPADTVSSVTEHEVLEE